MFKAELEREFADASHITFAYKFFDDQQLQQRFSDAGEPSGTAGKPILMHIEGQGLIQVVIFVVRYFGGVKLGAGGLVRAYGNTTKQLILDAPLADYIPKVEIEVRVPYSEQNRMDYLCRKHKAEILERRFAEDLSCRIRLPESEQKVFIDALMPFLRS